MSSSDTIQLLIDKHPLQSLEELGFDSASDLTAYLEDQFCSKKKSFLLIPGNSGGLVNHRTFLHYCNQTTRDLYNIVIQTVPIKDYPTSLADFNYYYNSEGELRNSINDDTFHFVSQRHYDAMGNFIYRHIQDKLVHELSMRELFLSDNENPATALGSDQEDVEDLKQQLVQERLLKNNIFMTPDALENPHKLLILLQGTGYVRAGQWARALCMNHNLHVGSQIEYIEKAVSEGYGVIVLNPNLNRVAKPEVFDLEMRDRWTVEGFLNPQKPGQLQREQTLAIPGHESSEQHVITVWDQFISKSKAKHVVMVAHSAGGWNSNQLLVNRTEEVLSRLRAIAYTDAVYLLGDRDPAPVKKFISENTINWVKSSAPLDTVVRHKQPMYTPECRSAGHELHEWTSACCISSAMDFLRSKIGE